MSAVDPVEMIGPPCAHPGLSFAGLELSNAERSEGIGAHVTAAEAIEANSVLLTELPFASVFVDEHATTSFYCHYCFVAMSGDKAQYCQDCHAVWWCSSACASAAYAVHHGPPGECQTIRRLRGCFEGSRDARLLCRIRHVQLNPAVAEPKPEPEPVEGDADKAPPDGDAYKRSRASSPAGTTTCEGGEDEECGIDGVGGVGGTVELSDLVFHELDLDSAADVRSSAVWATAALASIELANSLLPSHMCMNVAEGMGILLRLRSNAFSLLDDNGAPLGIGVWLRAAFFNHSCQPNCCVHNNGCKLVFQVITQLAPGEEVCIPYLAADGDVHSRCARQKKLRQVYGFNCACARCEAQPDGPCIGGGGFCSNGTRRLCVPEASIEDETAAQQIYAEFQVCAEEGHLTRGREILRTLMEMGAIGVYAGAWAQHCLACHASTLQCSANP